MDSIKNKKLIIKCCFYMEQVIDRMIKNKLIVFVKFMPYVSCFIYDIYIIHYITLKYLGIINNTLSNIYVHKLLLLNKVSYKVFANLQLESIYQN